MSKSYNAIFRRFAEFLETHQAEDVGERDIRAHVLGLTDRPVGVGFVEGTLAKGYGANLQSLFPQARSVEDQAFDGSEAFMASGTIYREQEKSHKGFIRLLEQMPEGVELLLIEQGFLASSHSWSHAFREGKPEYACLGYVYDDISHYFMADYPNRINQKLNSAEEPTTEERNRARKLIDRIVRQKISKYNAQPMWGPAMSRGYTRRVLVCDQAFADASTIYGKVDETDFEQMLLTAIRENPDAEILLKTHPDTAWEKEKRMGYYTHLKSAGQVRILREPVNPFVLFDMVDTVYVGTSGMGLEALFAGKKVVCFGAPFYAGWGLTDDRQKIPHRNRRRSLEDIFHYFYTWYTIYHVPGRPVPSEIEDALDYIEDHRPYAMPPTKAEVQAPPKVSVILPVYNVEDYLEECLLSVQRQSLRELEIIPVNDCSPDRSQEIIDRLAATDPRIRPIVLRENVGQGFARNAGLEAARGDYVWFIDSDDWMPNPDLLKTVVSAAETNRSDMVRAKKAYEAIFSDNGQHQKNHEDESERFFTEEIAATTLRQSPQILHNRHFWTWLYRRDFLIGKNIRFLNTQWEERPFLLDALLKAERLTLTTADAVAYRIRPDSTAHRKKNRHDIDAIVQNFNMVTGLLLNAGATAPDSDLCPHLNFTLSQYVHYLFLGAPYRFHRPESREDLLFFLNEIGTIFKRCDFHASDFVSDPLVLSSHHLEAGAYPLMVAALRTGRYGILDRALGLHPITQKELYGFLLTQPVEQDETEYQTAINRYARNNRVVRSPQDKPASSPRPRILVHIGSTKTGSTSLQHLMENNRPVLLRQGVWYPEVGLFWQKSRPNKQAGHAQFAPAAIRNESGLREYIEAGLAIMDGKIHTIVLSSEAFFLNERACDIARYFGDFRVELVVYLRRQDEWASSQYAEFVAGGAVQRVCVPFEHWLENPVTRTRLDYSKTIRNWAHAVGDENVHVRIFEREQMQEGDLVTDFAAATNLPVLLDLPQPRPEQKNAAQLSSSHVELIRHYNDKPFRDQDAYFNFIQEVTDGLNGWRKSNNINMPRPWFPTIAQAAEIMAYAEAGNQEIARDFLRREDGVLFREPAKTAEATILYPEELALVSQAYECYAPLPGEGPSPKPQRENTTCAPVPGFEKTIEQMRWENLHIVNYGLFGWRLWALTPLVHWLYAKRSDAELQKLFLKEPALFARDHWAVRRPFMTGLLYPNGNPEGPFGLFRIWIPLLLPLARHLGGENHVQFLKNDPVRFVRSWINPYRRFVGRILFPCGELRKKQ